MTNSGSSANLLNLALLRPTNSGPALSPGYEELVPALESPTTISPVIQLGPGIIFTDIDTDSLARDREHPQNRSTPELGTSRMCSPYTQ